MKKRGRPKKDKLSWSEKRRIEQIKKDNRINADIQRSFDDGKWYYIWKGAKKGSFIGYLDAWDALDQEKNQDHYQKVLREFKPLIEKGASEVILLEVPLDKRAKVWDYAERVAYKLASPEGYSDPFWVPYVDAISQAIEIWDMDRSFNKEDPVYHV